MDDTIRILRYFQGSDTGCADGRRFGLEIETLAVEAGSCQPISWPTSQSIMSCLIRREGWAPSDVRDRVLYEVKRDGYRLNYDVGWNLFELSTPAMPLRERSRLFTELTQLQRGIYQAMADCDARPVFGHHVEPMESTVVRPTQADDLYWILNGAALTHLTCIAAVHFNIDLRSLDEAFLWIPALNAMMRKNSWPSAGSLRRWTAFLRSSPAGYEATRFKEPPHGLLDYCRTVAGHRVLARCMTGTWQRAETGTTIVDLSDDELDMHLSLTWWWSRLRVRSGRLVMEVRAVPRAGDGETIRNLDAVLESLPTGL